MKHTNKFDLDLAFGQKYENEFQKIVEGTVEIKADRLWKKTSNIFIEKESRGKPSGIEVSKARYWIFFLEVGKRKEQIFIGIPLKLLKKFVIGYPLKRGGDAYTSVGYVVPAKDLVDFYIQIKQFGEK